MIEPPVLTAISALKLTAVKRRFFSFTLSGIYDSIDTG
jgi:hypothetical protein